MLTKLIELRDEGTLIIVMAVQLKPGSDEERRLIARAGFGSKADDQGRYLFVSKLSGGEQAGTYNAYDWRTVYKSKTMFDAHVYLEKHWESVENCQVVDLQFIRGETKEAKASEVLV